MLMQTFLSATELGIPEVEKDALIKVLGMLERGEIDEKHFDMTKFIEKYECGTVGCLCGWAHEVSNGEAFPELKDSSGPPTVLMALRSSLADRLPHSLKRIFWIGRPVLTMPHDTGPDRAAQVLRTYLATGKDTWFEIPAA